MVDKVPLEQVGLPHVLDLAVHLVNFFGWVSQGGSSGPLLLLAFLYQPEHSFMLKSYGVGGGGPCDFSVSPSPFGLDLGTLDFWTSDLGLTIFHKFVG